MWIKLTFENTPTSGVDSTLVNLALVKNIFTGCNGHWEKDGKKVYATYPDAEYVVDSTYTVICFSETDIIRVKESPEYIFNVLNGETP